MASYFNSRKGGNSFIPKKSNVVEQNADPEKIGEKHDINYKGPERRNNMKRRTLSERRTQN